jgi:hypothetical protein
VRSGPEEKRPRTKKIKRQSTMISREKKYCDEPHLTLNKKTQPIQWTEWPTSALVAADSLWPAQSNHGKTNAIEF